MSHSQQKMKHRHEERWRPVKASVVGLRGPKAPRTTEAFQGLGQMSCISGERWCHQVKILTLVQHLSVVLLEVRSLAVEAVLLYPAGRTGPCWPAAGTRPRGDSCRRWSAIPGTRVRLFAGIGCAMRRTKPALIDWDTPQYASVLTPAQPPDSARRPQIPLYPHKPVSIIIVVFAREKNTLCLKNSAGQKFIFV